MQKTTNRAALAKQIQQDLARQHAAHDEWVAATVDLCRHLAEARTQFASDNAFHTWLADNDLGPAVLPRHERIAAIAMGKQPGRAKAVLEKTQRRSLQLIHRKEFRLPTARQPDQPTAATVEATFVAKPAKTVGRDEPAPDADYQRTLNDALSAAQAYQRALKKLWLFSRRRIDQDDRAILEEPGKLVALLTADKAKAPVRRETSEHAALQ